MTCWNPGRSVNTLADKRPELFYIPRLFAGERCAKDTDSWKWRQWKIEPFAAALAFEEQRKQLKTADAPFEVLLRATHSHPADARMTALLKGLARIGFTTEAGRVRDCWDEFTAVCGATREPEFVRCFPDRLLDKICDEALAGARAIG